LLQASLDACREKGLDVWRPIPSSMLGLACVLMGRADEGLKLLEDGVRLTEELGVRAYLSLWTVNLAEGLLAAGEPERARPVAQQALELALAHKERGHQALALRVLGDIAGAGAPAEIGEAEAYYGQALALAEEVGMRPLVARIQLGLGRLYAVAGRRSVAEEHLAAALGLLREMDMRFWLARAAEGLMALGHLFVVARYDVQLCDYLKAEFANEPVTVILDRREGERRGGGQAAGDDRRRADRRSRPDVDESLRTRGFAIIPRER
jgi:tetratricopeptide (TPR) repeat protein